ncbi:MAG: bifunctional phosphopantothenoylcysteine decarboxylase/phosphopantothenate--cysteine ligase CoaBC [Ruminococcus sp.]|nr:bifunctional phosphopantothenoylcysteine decarboxylase/phosphopantothenate--cysteine ligase CoaBC [Ruminococcus sp.]
MLKGKTIILGVSGSIAAYKSPNLARALMKLGADVQVIVTKNAENFINPITFESLTGNKCLVDTFDRNFQYSVEHVALAKRADAVIIAPASADVIGKIACGIADDMLTTTVMACPCKKIISPAMNHNMFHNAIVQDNIKRLSAFGYEIVPPDSGMLANGDSGDGRMPDESVLTEYVLRACAFPKDLAGKSVLVTAGATREAIDPVRFITNRSTGKMGFALARAAMLRGAHVTLAAGHTETPPPLLVDVIPVESAQDMADVVLSIADNYDIIIKAAAVADFTPVTTAAGKIKKSDGGLTLELRRTVDILAELGRHKRTGQVICGFSMETENLRDNSYKKLIEKNCDMICANSLTQAGAGFGSDTNIITLITRDGEMPLEIMSKFDAANKILDVLKG